MANDRIGRGILKRHPNLTKNGVFAVAVFTMELQVMCDDCKPEDKFYHQFGNALRYRNKDEMTKLKPYVYHLLKGLEALPKYQGTLWRGVHGDFAEVAGENFSLCNIVNFNGYSSASPDRNVAKAFVAGKGLLFKYVGVLHTARDVRECSAYPDEDE